MFSLPTEIYVVALLVWVVSSTTCPRNCRCLRGNEVECSHSGLLRVPVGLPDATERLFLDGSSISVIYAEDFRLLTNLRFLTLANGQLVDIQDDAFATLRLLEELNLNMNALRMIRPSTLQGLTSLRLLRIDQNHALRLAPCTFSVIPNAESINADITRIKFNESLFLNTSSYDPNMGDLSGYADEDFVSLDSLRYLRLERTDASAINHRAMSLMPNLVTLNLQNTAIQSLEDRMFRRNRFLTTLFLTENLISSIGNLTFTGLKRLQVLTLTSNHGVRIHPNTFLSTRKLKTLYLDKMGLTDLSINFFSFQQLTNLIISENELTYISPGTLSGVGSIRICLGQNPWHCDCNLVWLYEWLRQFSLGSLLNCVNPVCHTPSHLAGTPLMSMTRDAFQCINETITESPDRGTNTPVYRRFIIPWDTDLSPTKDDSAYTWLPYTLEPYISWTRRPPSRDSRPTLTRMATTGTPNAAEKRPTSGPLETAGQIPVKTTKGGVRGGSDVKDPGSIDRGNNKPEGNTRKPSSTHITTSTPADRPATGHLEVGNNDLPDDGITIIILATEAGTVFLIILMILWLAFAIRRLNRRRMERMRSNGLGMETVSPLRYFRP